MGAKDGYNFIFSKLVEDSNDILGIIAYSFYKQQKIEFIRAFENQNDREPTDDEMRVFYVTSNSDASLESYNAKAEALTREFINAVIGAELEQIQEDSDKELTRRVKSLKPNFWSGVAQNVFASLLFLILIGLVLFVAWSSKSGMTQAVEQVMGVEIKESPKAVRDKPVTNQPSQP
jgi:ATP-dependent Zn protease